MPSGSVAGKYEADDDPRQPSGIGVESGWQHEVGRDVEPAVVLANLLSRERERRPDSYCYDGNARRQELFHHAIESASTMQRGRL